MTCGNEPRPGPSGAEGRFRPIPPSRDTSHVGPCQVADIPTRRGVHHLYVGSGVRWRCCRTLRAGREAMGRPGRALRATRPDSPKPSVVDLGGHDMAGRKSTTTPAAAAVRPVAQPVKTVAVKDRKIQAQIRRLRECRAEIARLSEVAKEAERAIKSHMGDAEEATVGGVKVVTWKTAIRQSLSATLVKKGYPEVAAECTVQTEVRTFKLVDPE